ncbi:MAG: hypothetical protein IJU58_00095 [Clostridia bacterium]|nr:hypothetical protein [Clostridia bacterium]
MSIIKMRHDLSYYLKLFDERKSSGDLFGALDAGRNALRYAKTRIDKDSINLLLGQVYYEMGLFTLSCEYYFRAVQVPSSRAGAYFGIGRNMVCLKRYILSLDYFDKVLEWDCGNFFTQSVLEWTDYIKQQLNASERQAISEKLKNDIKKHIKQQDYVNAMQLIKTNTTQDTTMMLFEAECYIGVCDFNNARKIIKLVLSQEPNNTMAMLLLCIVCSYDGDETSLNILLERLNKDNLSSAQLLTLAELYAGLKKYNNAIQILNQILKSVPYSPKVFLFLGICYHNLGDKQNALYYLAQARWIDFENPNLSEFLRIFSNDDTTLPLTDKIPLKSYQQKLKVINNALMQNDFIKQWIHSPIMIDHTDWLLTTNEYDLVQQVAGRFCLSNNKRIKRYFEKALLSVRPNLHQKFILTREAMRNSNLRVINLNANLTYRSFYNILPKFCYSNDLFKKSVTSAKAYTECYANFVNIIPVAISLYKQISKQQLDNKLDENILTCLMFSNSQVLLQVCKYFDVDVAKVLDTKNILKII